MRIIHVISRLNYGGAAALVAQWSTYLKLHTEHQVDVCTVYSKGQFAEQLESQGITVYSLDLEPAGNRYHPRRKYDFRVVLPLARLVRDGNYDILHAHLFPTSLFVALVSFFASRPRYIFSEHSVFNRRRRFGLFKILDWSIYRRYAQIVAVSEEVCEALLRWLPGLGDKVQVVPNSVDPARFRVPDSQLHPIRQELRINEEERDILYAGRLIPAKGPDVLLEALLHLSAENMSIRVLVAGDGPLEETLRKQATVSALDGRVTFLGLRKDIPLLLNLADLVVLPSRWEGLPIILLEAMAARRPVVATAVGGIPEVIEHGVSGWLVPPEDPLVLAEAIALLLESPDLCECLGDEAFRRVCAQYSAEVTIKKFVDIYFNVL
jgi:glycosyltransferase involved in cell wall biosynthesis